MMVAGPAAGAEVTGPVATGATSEEAAGELAPMAPATEETGAEVTVVPMAMTLLETTVLRAGQLVTSAAHEVMVY